MLIYPKVKVQYPMSLEREYARELVKYTRKVRDICKRHIPSMVDAAMWNAIRTDDWTEEQTEEIDNEITAEEKAAIMAIILAMFNRVKTFNRRQQEKIFRSVFGATPKEISKEDYEKIKQIWVNQNIELIHSIDRRTLESIRYTLSENIIRAVDRKMLVEELADSIARMAEVNEKRAALIACDQVGKLNSQLAQLEQMNQGCDSYIWTTMKDNRVRPQHAAREGKRYYWNDPPSDGHPGWPIRCRCIATPVYDTDKMQMQPRRNSYTQYQKNGIIKEKIPSGALNPYSERAEKHAIQYYETVRNRKTDAERIARNTGFSEKDIETVRQYVFLEKHDLGINGVRRFFPSYMMAESWRRMFEGKDIQPHDLTMIRHELLERQYMLAGVPQNIAHEKAEKKYNYRKEAEEYHAKVSGRKKDK